MEYLMMMRVFLYVSIHKLLDYKAWIPNLGILRRKAILRG